MDALEGVRVLDLTTGIAGPLGVLLLAEHGADVIKVEPPGGLRDRDREEHRVWDRSRRSVTIDFATEEGREQLRKLAAVSDVLVESFAPGTMGRHGLGYDALAASCPRLVYVSVPAYPSGSRHAARPGWDALVQARSGLQWEQPGWREGPIFLQNQLPSMAAAYLVPIGILAALSAREETGRGQHVETSLLQGALTLTTMIWLHAEHGQIEVQRAMSKSYPPGIHQASIWETSDGWVHTSASRGAARPMAEVLGLPPEHDPMMLTLLSMSEAPEDRERAVALRAVVSDAYRRQKRDALVEEFHANGLGAEAIVPMSEVLHHAQLRATAAVVDVEDPEVGPTTQLGITLRLVDTPGRVRGPRPPLGAHNDEVLGSLASASLPAAASGAPLRAHAHALADVRVLDFGRAFAGPFATMILAGLGADVIKVQAPGVAGMSGGPELGCNQGKRSIAVDMKHPDGRRVAHRLIERSDVVHHNMTKGVAERLGIDHATLAGIRPDIISCNTFMYGPEGPLSDLGGLDPLAQAAAGLEYEAGPVHEGNVPLWYRFGHGDTANALSSVVAVLMALHHRKRTGNGQPVWATLLHASALWSSGVYLTPDGPCEYERLDRDQTGLSALYRLYAAQGGWIQLAAVRPEHWSALCAALCRPDLESDARFATPSARHDRRSELEAELAPQFATRTPLQWRRALDAVGVPCEIAVDTNDGESVLFDDELLALGIVAETRHRVHGRLRQVGQLVRFSETPGRVEHAPPVVGQHTVEIMRWLGYDDGEIVSLRERDVIEYPEDTLPGDALPGDALPEEAVPEEAVPEEAVPEEAVEA
jgi:crotonobetainyl-CoA:carnitine CoA-transferase CaiB-like acyl-CoA transferase